MKSDLGTTVASSHAELGADWDEFVGDHPFASRRWLAVSEACLRDYEPRYVAVRRRGEIVGAAVCARQRHFNLSAYVQGPRLLPLARRAIFRLPPLSVQSAPFGFPGVIVSATSPAERRTATLDVLTAIESVALRVRAPFVGVNNLPERPDAYRERGYSFFDALPEGVIDLPPGSYSSYAEYEQALEKKHRQEVRRVRNKAFRAGVKLDYHPVGDLPAHDVERLQRMVHARHGNAFPNREGYVRAAEPHLDPAAVRLITASLDGRAVVALGVFKSGPTAVLRWMGIDYDAATDAHAYHLVMSEGVGQAIDLGAETLVLGATSLVFKKKLGARIEDRFIAARPATRLAGRVLQRAIDAKRARDA